MNDLQQLKHFVKLADAYEDLFVPESDAAKESKELMEKAKKAKKKPRTEMLAQTQFSNDGPALFMETRKRIPITLQGCTIKMRLWKQPRNYDERPTRRSLRLRRGAVPRITST